MELLMKTFEKVATDLKDARILLHEALYILNQVPNNTYQNLNPQLGKSHYELCSRIDEFLKEE